MILADWIGLEDQAFMAGKSSSRVVRHTVLLKLIAAIRQVLRRRALCFGVGILVWLLVSGLVWVLTEDVPEWLVTLSYFGIPIVIGLHLLLESCLDAGAERIARRRLRAAEPYYQNANSFLEVALDADTFLNKLAQYDLAVVEFGIVLSIDPDNARAYTGRGNVYELKGDHDLAIADFTTAIGMDPYIRGLARRPSMAGDAGDYDLAWAYYYRGCAYKSKGDANLSERDFRDAIAVGHVGFPKALTHNNLMVVQQYESEYAGTVDYSVPEDPKAVHYVRPCEAVMANEGLNFLYSKYYIAVTCNACLENRPKKEGAFYATESAPGKAAWALSLLIIAMMSFTVFLLFKDGELGIAFMLFLLILSSGFLFINLWDACLGKATMKIVKPLAAKYLARPSYVP